MRFCHVGLFVLGWACAHAGEAIYSKGRLNHSTAHQAYLEAEWKTLARQLEKFLSDRPKRADRVDSIFAFKYLGVIYASNPATLPQGEAKFRKLLAMTASVDTADFQNLYAAPEVMALFRRLREEYPRNVDETQLRSALSVAEGTGSVAAGGGAGEAGGAGGGAASTAGPAGRRKWVLLGAAGAALTAGVGAYFYVLNSEPSGGSPTRIPVDL